MPDFNLLGISIRPTVNFWPCIAIFKTYCMLIRPLARALVVILFVY